ncbi:hypothetical protein BCR44DRAFT_91577 [Catenaria anguillulae PL171]|uniref:Ankyrin repeat-containing domain protein n=1 Tax=Catenaria anguillulae PL171 TaxID=765915 RepID=A0A1Y2HE92_9FUNG|nr:hypothetical protein BCR44DRAFT_91577 [Catenaria anguillulae PL171]
MVAPDLPLAQQTVLYHHPDFDVVEMCVQGALVMVKTWFMLANRTQTRVPASTIVDGITAASANGHVHILEWLHRCSGRRLIYSHQAMDEASAAGHVDVLQWWLDSGLKLRYTYHAIDGASGNGEVDALVWWVASGLELKHSEQALDSASAEGRIESLQWLLEHRFDLEPEYSAAALHDATAVGNIAVLEWWKESGWELKFDSERIVSLCIVYGHAHCLEWWVEALDGRGVQPGLARDFDDGSEAVMCSLDEYWAFLRWRQDRGYKVTPSMYNNVIALAAEEGRLDVLKWWADAEPDLRERCGVVMGAASATGQLEVIEWLAGCLDELGVKDWVNDCDMLIDAASSRGHVNVLGWWKQRGLDLKYTHLAIDDACANGHLDVMKWWSESGVECRYTGRCVDKAAGGGHIEILRWLHEQPSTAPLHFPQDYTCDAMDSASCAGYVAPLQFFLDSGHPLKYTQQAMDEASKMGFTHVLDWWLQHKDKLALKFSGLAIDSDWITIPILEWWNKSALGLSLDIFLDSATYARSLTPSILAWVRSNGYQVEADDVSLKMIGGNGRFDLVEYVVEEVGIRPSLAVVEYLKYDGNNYIADWLRDRM